MIQQASEQTGQATEPAATLLRDDQIVASRARLTATDGISLHYRAWLPASGQAACSLVFLHGIASHGAWFAETATHLAQRGIAVYAPDRRGSGLSGGLRGHIDQYEQALDDLDRVIEMVEAQQPATPLFLASSSWAAKLAIAYAAQAQARLTGLLLLGPGLFPKVDLSLGRKLAVLVNHRFNPERQIQIPLIPASYTRNGEYLEYVRRDPYRLRTASARFFWETRRLDRARTRLAATLTLPVLLQIGDADPIMDAPATCRWLQRLTTTDRTAITYQDASHTLDFEGGQTVRAYRADLLGWLRRQIALHPVQHTNQRLNDEPGKDKGHGR